MFRRSNFIERSLTSALSFLKDVTLGEEYASRQGFLQSLDPRMKTIAFLFFLLTTVSLKSPLLISGIYLGCLALAILSKVPMDFFLIRTWVFIPLFSLFIVIPALFSFVTPGEPLWVFYILGTKFIITRPGFDGAVLFVIRIATSVSLVVLLSLTTRHEQLLKVLRVFGVPSIFVLTVSMCYRYLYLLAVMVENIFTAIKSRVGVLAQSKKGQRVVAWNIANTWSRTNQMSEEVYQAMLSRGYTGEPQLLNGFKSRRRDWVWVFFVMVLGAGLFCWEYSR
jgi:cobalt/nickel transport system permease protein